MSSETTTLKINRLDLVTSEYTIVRRKSDGGIISVILTEREFDFKDQWSTDFEEELSDTQLDEIDEEIYELQEAEGKRG